MTHRWLIIRCRARYRVVHLEWNCRACRTAHAASHSERRVCRHCGKRRHFVSHAPLGVPAACVLIALYGALAGVFGGVMLRYEGALDKKRLVKLGDVQLSTNYQMSEAFNVHTIDMPMTVKIEYAELYTDLPVHIDPMLIVVTYVRRSEYFKQQIGRAEVPALKMYPGDSLSVSMTMHVEMESDTLASMMREMASTGATLEMGPSVLNYEIRPGRMVSWVLGNSDLKVQTTAYCAIVSTFQDVVLANCSDQGETEEQFSEFMNPYFILLTVAGCGACALATAFFEWHIRSVNAESEARIAEHRSTKRASLAPAAALKQPAGLHSAPPPRLAPEARGLAPEVSVRRFTEFADPAPPAPEQVQEPYFSPA
jgi:hypothetical protein